MNYTDYEVEIAALMPTSIDDPTYQALLPRCIEYAEERCYQDLDLLAQRVTDDSGALTPNQRLFTLPTSLGAFLVVEEVSVFNPSGTLNRLLPVSREVIDAFWPTNTAPTTPSVPTMFCMRDDKTILVGPPPDSSYSAEVVGTIQPTALSQTNQSTPLTVYVPQLFVAASMIFMSGRMHDFSPMSDDPQLPVTWSQQYNVWLKSAAVQEWRKKWSSSAWSTRLPAPTATPPQV